MCRSWIPSEDEVRIVTESRLGSRLAAAPSRSHKLTMKCDFKIFSGQIFSNARILHIYPSPFQLFLWFTLDDDEEEEYDEEAADDEQDGAGLGLVAGLLLGEAGGRVVAVEAQQGRQVQPGQVVARVPGDHRHHAAAAHGGDDVSGRVAAHGACDIASDMASDV